MSRGRLIRLGLVVLLAASVLGPVSTSDAKEKPNLAYAIAINIPEFEGQDASTFTCQICNTNGTTPTGGKSAADYLVTIDMDKKSPTYGRVIARNPVPGVRPELHHMGISSDSSRLALYDLYQNAANIFDIGTDPRQPAFLRSVDLAAASRALLGPVAGLTDGAGNPVSVGYATPHVSYRMPNGNFMIAMGAVDVPEVPSLDLGAPGGFIEMTPEGSVVRAFPKLRYENGALTNGLFDGKGVFSVDYNARMGLMAHADLMTARQFLCLGFALAPNTGDFGNQVTLWNYDAKRSADPTVFQTITLPSPFVTAPAFVDHPVNGQDVIFVSTFTAGLFALHRPTGTNQQFVLDHVFSTGDSRDGLVHMRVNPVKDVLYASNPYGDEVLVLDFHSDPLHPTLIQEVPVDEVHMMKFSADNKTLMVSNGLASVLSFALNTSPFSPDYGLTEYAVRNDGTLVPGRRVFDGSTEGAPFADPSRGVFIGDFYLRQNPQAEV